MKLPAFLPRIRPAEWLLIFGTILLVLCVFELAMRVADVPQRIISGWRSKNNTPPPIHQLGLRGRDIQVSPSDFVIVLVGDSQVECAICPADETMDVILERAVRPYVPNARVVSLGGPGYGQDQEALVLDEYLARWRSDLIVVWLTPVNDVWNNTFRTAGTLPGRGPPKPTFWLHDGALNGPTEAIGMHVYTTRLGDLLYLNFGNFEIDWAQHLPPADPGSALPFPGLEVSDDPAEDLPNQRSHWSIWLDPRPTRVSYGITLTRALLRRMQERAEAHGAGFMVLVGDDYALTARAQAARIGMRFFVNERAAVGHAGHWYVVNPRRFQDTVADLIAGFPSVQVPVTVENPRLGSHDLHFGMPANREIMAGLAIAIRDYSRAHRN